MPHLNGGDLVSTMGETLGGQGNQRLRHRVACAERSSKQKGMGEGKGGQGNQRLRHRVACAERSSKQKGMGEGKGGKEEGSISEVKGKLPQTKDAAEEGWGQGVAGQEGGRMDG